jgi:uncharacterized protein YecE (DUF72 family)
MEFGRTEHIERIDFSLPPDDPVNELLWQQSGAEKQQPVRLYVGCTQWGRTDWVGKVYPKGTKQKDFLAHYVKQFNCIELNSLFYGLQPREVIQRWASLADKEFRFCPKMSESISHRLQLRNAQEETELFIDHVSAFGDKMGTSFLQLSENFGPDRATLLQDYLRSLPRDFPLCVELRHKDWFGKDWFNGSAAGAYRIMMENKIGTVITDTAGRRDVLHMRLTAPVVFIRWVGNSLHPTDLPRIEAWAHRLKAWMDKGLREIYFIVHNHNEFLAPDLQKLAVERFNAICGTSLKPPRLTMEPPPLTLF